MSLDYCLPFRSVLRLETLLRAIGRVHQGEVWFDKETKVALLSAAKKAGGESAARIATLTKREREMVF